MDKKNIILIVLAGFLVLSLAGNGLLMYKVVLLQNAFQARQHNSKVMDFRNMFTENVLLSEQEVDFETRLLMENAVRNLNDQEIFNQWQRFTKTSTPEEASLQAKVLLRLLIEKTAGE